MSKPVSATKKRVRRVLNQAKESFKLFETLERKKLANDKILTSLKKMGVATQDEMNSLLMRIEKLEASLATQSPHRDSEFLPHA